MTPLGVPVEPDVYWRKAKLWSSVTESFEYRGLEGVAVQDMSVGILSVASQIRSEESGSCSQLF